MLARKEERNSLGQPATQLIIEVKGRSISIAVIGMLPGGNWEDESSSQAKQEQA